MAAAFPRPPAPRWLLLAVLAGPLLAADPAAAVNPQVLVSLGANATIGSVTAANEDLLVCDAVTLGENNTTCNWSLFFDGSAAGLNSSIDAVELLPNGSLVIRAAADGSIPDLSAIKRKDLALFIPRDPFVLPYAQGEWRLYLDGDAVKGSSDNRVWDAMAVLTDGTCENAVPPTCDVLLSLPSGSSLGGVAFGDEDIIRCHPTAWSLGGAITACDYTLFLDSSAINGGGAGSFTGNLFGFDVTASDTLIFRGPGSSGLPAHEAQRDLLRYVGTFGTTPVGTTEFWFDGSTAGLGSETVKAVAVASGVCGDAVVNPPFEKCDVGNLNGVNGSGCTSDCRLSGHCTTSGATCASAADCPSGEGCCGDGHVDGPEQCDDGNTFSDDLCSAHCQNNPAGIPIVGCQNSQGPHVVPGFAKKVTFKDADGAAGFDRWKSGGDFNLTSGAFIDPDTELVTIVFNQGSTPFYQAALAPPGKFTQSGNASSPKWKFMDREADVPLALGWRKAQLARKFNKVKFTLDGLNATLPASLTPPIRMRQSIHVGNECATTVLDCTLASSGKVLTCVPAVGSSASAAFLD